MNNKQVINLKSVGPTFGFNIVELLKKWFLWSFMLHLIINFLGWHSLGCQGGMKILNFWKSCPSCITWFLSESWRTIFLSLKLIADITYNTVFSTNQLPTRSSRCLISPLLFFLGIFYDSMYSFEALCNIILLSW